MIKIKLLNSSKGRNEAAFDNFAGIHWTLYEMGIELLWHKRDGFGEQFTKKAETSDYDFLIIGPEDFCDKSKPLQETVDWGLENVYKHSNGGDYFLLDSFDSTSLCGTYEVFEQSDAIYLLKNQMLKNREDYKIPSAFGKWFFGDDSEFNKSYDIPKKTWDRIKLSGQNLGHTYMTRHNIWRMRGPGINGRGDTVFSHHRDRFFGLRKNPTYDVSGIYQADIRKIYEYSFRNDLLYMKHRKSAWDILNKLNTNPYINVLASDKVPIEEYRHILTDSKVVLSPYGQGEICYRDFECIQFGTLMIKPDMSNINTCPNIYQDGDTYISCKYDWSDLQEKIEYVLSNYERLNKDMNFNIRKKFMEMYSSEYFSLYIYNLFRNLDNVGTE